MPNMPDQYVPIQDLTIAGSIGDDDLFPMSDGSGAYAVRGSTIKSYAASDAAAAADDAALSKTAAQNAATAAGNAQTAAEAAQAAAEAVDTSTTAALTTVNTKITNLQSADAALFDTNGIVKWFPNDTTLAAVPGSGTSTSLGVKNVGNTVTIDGTSDIDTIRIKLSGFLYRASSANSLKNNSSPYLPFVNGHKYGFRMTYVGGSVPEGKRIYILIRDTSHNVVLSIYDTNPYQEVIWASDGGGYCFAYGEDYEGETISNYTFTFSIVDLTISPANGVVDSLRTTVNTYRTEADVYRGRIGAGVFTKRITNISVNAGGINSTEGTTNGSAFNELRCKTDYIPVSGPLWISLNDLTDYRWTVFAYSNNSQTTGTHSCMWQAGYKATDIEVITNYKASDRYIRIAFERVDGANLTTDTSDPESDYSIILANLSVYALDDSEEGQSIKAYYETEMSDTVASVRACQTEPCLVMPLVTDIHWATDSLSSVGGDSYLFTKESIVNIKKFASEVKCDGLICLGDITDGGSNSSAVPSSAANAVTVCSELMNKMRSVGVPFYFTMGNHDDCRYFDTWMTLAQIYATYMSQADKDVVFDLGYYGMNWYRDFDQFGVRLIQIDTNKVPTNSAAGSYGVATQTVTFLTNALASMDAGWLAVIITHCPVIADMQMPGASSIPNTSAVVSAINNSGKTAIVMTGHTHFDLSVMAPFVHVITAANKNTLRDADANIETQGAGVGKVYVRQLDTGTKDLWDVVVIRPISRILDFVRFGSGKNRRFHITPIAPTTVTTYLSGTISWASSNAGIATVDGGVITGVSSGRCGIVAMDETGNTESWAVVVA